MLAKFTQHITQLVTPKQPILLAVSGGVDSMVLLHLFLQTDHKFGVAHCNFQLRDEAEREAELVRHICEQNNIPFHSITFNTKAEIKNTNESLQMVARRLRYDYFYSLCNQYSYQYIATAHHANDNAETILLNLTKGTGVRGLVGIAEKTDQLIRPLLNFTKQEIYDFAREQNIAFFEDETNAKSDYQRNFIRNKVLPLLAEINPEATQAINRTAENLKFAQQLFTERFIAKKLKLLHQDGENIVIYRKQLLAQPFSFQLLFELLREFDFEQHQVETMYNLMAKPQIKPSKVYASVTHAMLIDSRERLLIAKKQQNTIDFVQIDAPNQTVTVAGQSIIIKEVDRPEHLTTENHTIYIAADKLVFPLQIRKWTAGDYFYPFGLGKKKKISKFLINEKVHQLDKEQQLVLTSEQKIVWVIGRRLDDRFKIDAKTKKIYQLSVTTITK